MSDVEMFKTEIIGLDFFEKKMNSLQETFGDLKPLFRRLLISHHSFVSSHGCV